MKKAKILTVTLNPAIDYSVVVPSFRTDHVNRATGGRRDPGGKGINAATITAGYGIDTTVTGFLGTDNSLIFDNHFKTCGFRDEFIYVEGSTREGIKITDPADRVTTDINFNGFDIEQKAIDEFIFRFERLAVHHDMVLMSGSLPEGLPADFYAILAVIAKNADLFTAVDTSGEALRAAVESGTVDLIKPNEHELVEAFGDAGPADLLSRVGMVLLSLGEDGSRLYTADAVYEASAPAVDAVSTVGAGDSFLAGFISALSFGKAPDDSLRFAAATAASKLTKYGPGVSIENPPGGYYDSIKVRRIS